MKIITTWKQDMAFDSVQDGHFVYMNGGTDPQGNRMGFSPKALLLAGLAGCSGVDVVEILQKMKVHFTSLIISTEAEQTDEHPRVFKEIMVTYTTNVAAQDKNKLERAIQLSLEKYCGVAAMLRKNNAIHYRIELT